MNASSAVPSLTTRIPHFVFVARSPPLAHAWRRAVARYFPDEACAGEGSGTGTAGGNEDENFGMFTVCEGRLQDLDPAVARHDCIVSPANSFGIMDGG